MYATAPRRQDWTGRIGQSSKLFHTLESKGERVGPAKTEYFEGAIWDSDVIKRWQIRGEGWSQLGMPESISDSHYF
jgi:hypothetical protein